MKEHTELRDTSLKKRSIHNMLQILENVKLPKKTGKSVMLILLVIMVGTIAYLLKSTVSVGGEALKNSFIDKYATEESSAYQKQYKRFFDDAENKYHVSNIVAISIDKVKEIAKLEVLEVSDVEYIVEESSGNSNGIESWLEVPGHGTYVVDLQAAEFIKDDERAYVKVRAPYPELTNITIDYGNVKKLFFKNDILNDSYKVGEELAQRQLNSADMLIKKEFASNERFYLSAQDAAVSTIQCMIKQLNPQNTDMTVDVEFY